MRFELKSCLINFCTMMSILMSHSSVAKSVLPPVFPEGEHLKNYPDMSTDILEALQDYRLTSAAAFSPDGKFIAAGASDNTIKVWNFKSKKLIYSFKGHEYKVTAVAFSSNGIQLASGDFAGKVKLWNVKTGKQIRMQKDNYQSEDTMVGFREAKSIEFSFDGSFLSVKRHSDVLLWDLKAGNLIPRFSGHISQVSFSPNNHIVALSSFNEIKLWDSKQRKMIAYIDNLDNPSYSYMMFSHDGNRLAAISSSNIVMFDVKTNSKIFSIEGEFSHINFFVFSKDDQLLFFTDKKGIKVVNLKKHEIERKKMSFKLDFFEGSFSFNAKYGPAIYSPNQELIAVTRKGDIELWNIDSNQLIHTFSGHSMYSYGATISPDGNTLVNFSSQASSTRENERLLVWDLKNHLLLHSIGSKGARIKSIGGDFYTAGYQNGSLELKDIESQSIVNKINIDNIPDNTALVKFSQDGRLLAIVDDNNHSGIITVIDVESGVQTKINASCSVKALAFSKNGKKLTVGCFEELVRFLDIKAGKVLYTIELEGYPYLISYNNDNKRIVAVTYDLYVYIIDVENYRVLNKYITDSSSPSIVAFSPDGNVLISKDNKLNVWNSRTANLMKTLESNIPMRNKGGLLSAINSISFVSGSNQLAIGFNDKIEVWDMLANEPSLRIFYGENGNWIIWNNEGQFWRGDDGTLLLNNDFSPLPRH